jgi:hypothetical protein
MAGKIKIDGARKAPKPRAVRTSQHIEEKYTGPEPEWKGDESLTLSDDEFDNKLRRSMNWYNHHYTPKDSRKHVVEWLKGREGVDPDIVESYRKTAERLTPMTVCSLVMASKKKMPMKEHHIEFILDKVNEAIRMANDKLVSDAEGPVLEDQSKVKKEKVVAKVAKPSVRDRVNEIVDQHIAIFEEMEDEFYSKKQLKPDAFAYFTAKSFPKPGLNRFKAVFEAKRDELIKAQTSKDKQLKEGYSHFSAADFKKRIDFYNAILNDVAAYDNAKKAVRKPRVKKAPSKEKLVSKVKYCKQDAALKLTSVNPINIVGAKTVWIYQTKYRKIGCYVADATIGTMSIKGTSIIGFDEAKSVCKTVRKPEVTLAEFMKAGKVQLRKFMSGIKATEVKLTGRLSEDILILKVE